MKLCSDKDPTTAAKKGVMGLLGSLLGIGVVLQTDITLLGLLVPKWKDTTGDILVSGLVIGAGTEGLNIVTKYFDYIKQYRKANLTPLEVAIIPASVSVKQGKKFQFRAAVNNAENQNVSWEVSHGAGGTISGDGKYVAPPQAGTYQVVAVSDADPTKQAIAKVTVT